MASFRLSVTEKTVLSRFQADAVCLRDSADEDQGIVSPPCSESSLPQTLRNLSKKICIGVYPDLLWAILSLSIALYIPRSQLQTPQRSRAS